jgi:GTP-binding protein Era
MPHKAGFVNIIGNPNVGKSTLMNELVGEKLSIITHKAQTTRHRILGIVNGEDYQIVFSDTPGIITPHYKLQESMMKQVESAFEDADILLLITDISHDDTSEETITKIKSAGVPVIIVINKIDLADQAKVETRLDEWKKIIPDAEVIPVSALMNFNTRAVLERILDRLPEAPPFYEKDTLTDKSERFLVSEIIREKILNNYQKEVPYSVEISVDTFKEDEKIYRIIAFIFVTRESQKAILLGHEGKAIKKVGMQARKDLEAWLGKQVYLELTVKVDKNWRDDERELKRFGYEL